MERCNICYDREAQTKIDNGDLAVCKKCYDNYSSYLFKGDFSMIEVNQADKENMKYFKNLITLIKMMKLVSEREGIIIEDEIMDLRKQENIMSVDVLKKTRNCLTKVEHNKFIERNISDLIILYGIGEDELPNNIPERIIYLARRYIKECSYLDVVVWEGYKFSVKNI
jgi:hypothetical protein